MADDTNTAERESFEAWVMKNPRPGTHLKRSHSGVYLDNRVAAKWAAFQAGRASLAASAGSEPVALDHIACIEDGELRYMTGRKAPSYDCELYAMPGGKSAPPLYLHPSPPEGAGAEQALRKVLSVVQRYLPPDGPSAHDAMSEITAIVDPWPLGPLEKP